MAGDWRETIFYWRGLLTGATNDSKEDGRTDDSEESTFAAKRLVWEGTWVGSEEPTCPSKEEFVASENKFKLHSAERCKFTLKDLYSFEKLGVQWEVSRAYVDSYDAPRPEK